MENIQCEGGSIGPTAGRQYITRELKLICTHIAWPNNETHIYGVKKKYKWDLNHVCEAALSNEGIVVFCAIYPPIDQYALLVM